MLAVDDRVGRRQLERAGRRAENRAIVADALGLRRARRSEPVAQMLDEADLAERRDASFGVFCERVQAASG